MRHIDFSVIILDSCIYLQALKYVDDMLQLNDYNVWHILLT